MPHIAGLAPASTSHGNASNSTPEKLLCTGCWSRHMQYIWCILSHQTCCLCIGGPALYVQDAPYSACSTNPAEGLNLGIFKHYLCGVCQPRWQHWWVWISHSPVLGCCFQPSSWADTGTLRGDGEEKPLWRSSVALKIALLLCWEQMAWVLWHQALCWEGEGGHTQRLEQ